MNRCDQTGSAPHRWAQLAASQAHCCCTLGLSRSCMARNLSRSFKPAADSPFRPARYDANQTPGVTASSVVARGHLDAAATSAWPYTSGSALADPVATYVAKRRAKPASTAVHQPSEQLPKALLGGADCAGLQDACCLPTWACNNKPTCSTPRRPAWLDTGRRVVALRAI